MPNKYKVNIRHAMRKVVYDYECNIYSGIFCHICHYSQSIQFKTVVNNFKPDVKGASRHSIY